MTENCIHNEIIPMMEVTGMETINEDGSCRRINSTTDMKLKNKSIENNGEKRPMVCTGYLHKRQTTQR